MIGGSSVIQITRPGSEISLLLYDVLPETRLGWLMVNPGGPGTSNSEFALPTTYFSPEIMARFDIVGVDMRGTGSSREFIRCPDSTEPAPSNEPVDQSEFDAFRAYDRKLVAD